MPKNMPPHHFKNFSTWIVCSCTCSSELEPFNYLIFPADQDSTGFHDDASREKVFSLNIWMISSLKFATNVSFCILTQTPCSSCEN